MNRQYRCPNKTDDVFQNPDYVANDVTLTKNLFQIYQENGVVDIMRGIRWNEEAKLGRKQEIKLKLWAKPVTFLNTACALSHNIDDMMINELPHKYQNTYEGVISQAYSLHAVIVTLTVINYIAFICNNMVKGSEDALIAIFTLACILLIPFQIATFVLV